MWHFENLRTYFLIFSAKTAIGIYINPRMVDGVLPFDKSDFFFSKQSDIILKSVAVTSKYTVQI